MSYFTCDMVKGLRPYDLSVKYYVYTFIHLREICQYLLYVTYIIMCNGFVFGVADYPLNVR